MKKRTSRKKVNTNIDLIMLAVLLACTLFFLIEMIIGGLIPMKFILIIGVVLVVILLGLFISLHYGRKTIKFRRITMPILCVFLLIGSVYQLRIRNGIDGLGGNNTNVSLIHVVVPSESSLKKIEDVKDQAVAYVVSNDELTTFGLSEIEKYDVTLVAYTTIDEAMNALDNHDVSAILMTQYDFSYRRTNDEAFARNYKAIHQFELVKENTIVGSQKDITKEPFVVYLSGLGEGGLPNYNDLSDVNMLLLINPNKNHVELISIPRDSYVPNPSYDNYPDKLTHLGWNGMDALVPTIESVFGFEIDFYAKVSFSSLIEIVDTLGGIDVDVQLEFSEQDENRVMDMIHLYAGPQTLNGSQALAYARHRHTEWWGDSGRTFAQRQIVEAITKKMLSVEGVSKVPALLSLMSQYVDTNMDMNLARSFVNSQIDNLKPWSFSSTSLDTHGEQNGAAYCASAGVPAWVYILSQADINAVHAQYQSMFKDSTLSDFKFQLDDFSKYVKNAPINLNLVTVENFDQKYYQFYGSNYVEPPVVDEPIVDDPIVDEPSVDEPMDPTVDEE